MFISIFLLCCWHNSLREVNAIMANVDDKWITNEGKLWYRSLFFLRIRKRWAKVRLAISMLRLISFFFSFAFFFVCLPLFVYYVSFFLVSLHIFSIVTFHLPTIFKWNVCIPTYAQEFQPLTTMFALKENWEISEHRTIPEHNSGSEEEKSSSTVTKWEEKKIYICSSRWRRGTEESTTNSSQRTELVRAGWEQINR